MRVISRIASVGLVIGGMTAGPVPAQSDFSLQSLDGSAVASSSLRGKVVVLVFSGVQDPQCRNEFKALNSLAERYRGKEVGIFWVSVNPTSVPDDRLRAPCGPTGAVTVLRDPSQGVFKRFSGAAPQLPTTVILSKQGQPQGEPRGGFSPGDDFVNDLALVIDSLLM
jgi:peroxiredoxin